MNIVSLIISIISGLVGGNVAGAAMKDKSLGGVGNSVTGAIGGGIGGFIMQALDILSTSAAGTGGLNIGSLLGNVGGSGVTGAILLVIVALIKNAMKNKA